MGVCTATAGYNHIVRVPGVLVTHTPGVLQKAVAEYTLALILSGLRQIPARHAHVWNQGWRPGDRWDMDAFLGASLGNLTLGILGLGEIASELVRLTAPWNLRILYHSRKRKPGLEQTHPNLTWSPDLETVFRQSDILSLHLPLTRETRCLVNRDRLSLMKRGALLVNTARGDVVDLDALLDLLESGKAHLHLALDVFPEEPPPAGVIERFRSIAARRPDLGFILLPHTASADADTRAAMTSMMLDDLMGLIRARVPEDLGGLHLIPEQKNLLATGGGAGFRLFS
jgi:glyoxylate reductase